MESTSGLSRNSGLMSLAKLKAIFYILQGEAVAV